MKKKFIVKKNYEFQKIINNRSFIKTNTYFIYFKKNDLNYHRFGISVGKKLGNAVVRNKVKRQIRAILSYDFSATEGYDQIIIVRKPYFSNSYLVNKKILLNQIKM
ncbi:MULTISPECIES: ribonuclease P protein component [unclassified Spiroplasma]|uniref:ribonuclease P protein component n=1 Tax=unclassified Spiroplasma TaxID=2637901 RepID=UPI00089DBB99|nr:MULTISPECIES: ribonuclease P protein component [unclassified Spiroplasma]